MLTNKMRKSGLILIAVLAAFMVGAAGQARAFSVDVKNLFYSDASPRAINNYNFSSGSMVGPNTIGIPESFVTKFGTDQAFMFGNIPEAGAATVTLNTTAQVATISATEGAVVLQGSSSGPPPAPVNSWTYSMKLQNFAGITDSAKEYRFEIGMASPMAAGPQPRFRGVWSAGVLMLGAAIYDEGEGTTLWSGTPVEFNDLTPTATALELRIVNTGATVTFSYRLNNAANWTDSGVYTIPSGTFFQSLPARFPYLYLREKTPESPFAVSSQHWKDVQTGVSQYHAYPRVYDPGQNLYSAVTLSSNHSGYTPTELTYYSDVGRWLLAPPGQMEVVSLGNTPPTGVTFTFTATKKAGGTETVTLPITGYVTQMATNLAPTGSVTNPTPTFSWTGFSEATSYNVQVSDTSWNRLWSSSDIPAVTTSAVYSGTPLQTGQTYNYLVVSNIGENSSFAQGSFTYTGTTAPPISFSGWVRTSAGAAVTGATVNALSVPAGSTIGTGVTNDQGAFTITGIPASSTFRLVIPAPAGTTYMPVLSKWMNWNQNIQALRPFVLFTQAEYLNFGNSPNTGIIMGRVAMQNSPTTFLSGATVTATEWFNGAPTSTPYTVTYTSGTSTQSDGIYMVKNVPPGTTVQLTATLPGYTFEFNNAVIPVQSGFVSEESFFAASTISYEGYVTDNNNALGGVTVEQAGVPANSATSNDQGYYKVSNLPSGQPFHLKFTKAGYETTYTANMSSTANMVTELSQSFSMYQTGTLTTWGVADGKGIIRTRVRDAAGTAIDGATVTYTSSQNRTYTVCYDDLCSSSLTATSAAQNGRFIIKNVEPGDVVTATARKSGWTFNARTYHIYAGGISQGGITGQNTAADEQAIRDRLALAVAAVNAGNVSGFMNYVSNSYLNDGQTREALQADIQGLITGGGQLAHSIQAVSVQGDLATVQNIWTITIGGQQQVETATLTFRKEGGVWLIYGNQLRHSVQATSQRWASGYHASFYVDDHPGITAITVSGTGITGTINLTRTAGQGWSYNQPVVLGTTIPATTPTYTITVSEGTQSYTYNRQITGYVTAFATNLSPTGVVSGTVIFRWTGITGAAQYSVELNDANYNRLWNKYEIASGVTYDGPALENGKQYIYWIVSRDANGNASFAEGRFTYSITVPTNNLLANGGFSGNLNGWVVNSAVQTGTPPWSPLLADGSGVNLHPASYGFNGTILHQNLNLTGVAGKTFTVSVKLTNISSPSGKTVAVYVTYVDANGALQRVKVLNPDNSTITSGTVVTANLTVPAGAQKIVKLELAKEDYGQFSADDFVLWAEGVTSGPTPSITSLSAMSGAYGTTLTINGANFGTTQGSVRIGGVLAGIASWSNTVIVVNIASPIPSGPVLVVTGQVESDYSQPFQVTSPYFTVDILDPATRKVIKGQAAEFLLKSTFYNNFTTTAGISLNLGTGTSAALTGKATFSPVPIRGDGGVVMKIDTADLSAGTYTAEITAVSGAQTIPVGSAVIQVVTVTSIKVYEMTGEPPQKTYITSKTITKQGQFYGLIPEVTGSDGQIFTDIDVDTLTVTSSNPGVLGVYKRLWGYDFYALRNGEANLVARTPDGASLPFPVTVAFPENSWVSSISLSPSVIRNDRTEPITFFAQGTTALGWIGYDSSGFINLGIDFLDKLNRSSDNLSATSTFNLQNLPTDIGTVILYASTYDGAATAFVPLTTVNAAGAGLLSLGIRPLDSSVFAEMFKVYFFGGTDNQLKFVRDVYAMHIGNRPVLVGNIPPGTYKLLFVPQNPQAKPQWWPNAAAISGAVPVAFAADQTVDNIYFFAQPQPTGATVAIAPESLSLVTPAAVSGSFAVTAAADVLWAPTSDATWITITSGFTGSGNGTVGFAIAANTELGLRTGTVTIGNKTFTVTQPGTATVLKGDMNGDSAVNLADAILALRAAAGLNPAGIRANYATSGADVNGDGRVGAAEVIYILQYLSGLRQ